jgi:hypothetical protein
MIARVTRRVRQLVGALRPRVSCDERQAAYRWLSPPEIEVFESMMLRDQQHGIVVLRRVQAASSTDDAPLFAAALLHDCGKGRVALWQRVLHVVSPALEARMSQADGAGWRRALWRLRYHPELGAEMAAMAGSEQETVRLIREQDAAKSDDRLAILQAADNA